MSMKKVVAAGSASQQLTMNEQQSHQAGLALERASSTSWAKTWQPVPTAALVRMTG